MTSAPDRAEVALPCRDPECVDDTGRRSTAEPEQDGDHRYHECTTCGYVFGYTRIGAAVQAAATAESCSVGVPEDIRRAASAGMEHAIAAGQPGPLLTIGRRPHGEHTA